MSNLQTAKTKVIFLSFATFKKPQDVDVFIKAAGKDFRIIRKELLSHYPTLDAASVRDKNSQSKCSNIINKQTLGNV